MQVRDRKEEKEKREKKRGGRGGNQENLLKDETLVLNYYLFHLHEQYRHPAHHRRLPASANQIIQLAKKSCKYLHNIMICT